MFTVYYCALLIAYFMFDSVFLSLKGRQKKKTRKVRGVAEGFSDFWCFWRAFVDIDKVKGVLAMQ